MTIFTLGGCVLYQYCAVPSLVKHHAVAIDDADMTAATTATGGAPYTRHLINSVLIEQFLLLEYQNTTGSSNTNEGPSLSAMKHANKSYHIADGMTLHWKKHVLSTASSSSSSSKSSGTTVYIVAIYPDILFEGPRQYLKVWAEHLVVATIREYDTFYRSTWSTIQQQQQQQQSTLSLQHHRPDAKIFDAIFRIVLNTSKTQKQPTNSPEQPTTATTTTTTSNSKSNSSATNATESTKKANHHPTEKVQRNWYDGKGTITEKAMAALDRSYLGSSTTGDQNNSNSSGANDNTTMTPNVSKEEIQQLKQEQYERALRDARMAYLPSEQEMAGMDPDNTTAASSSSTTTTTTTITQSSWIVGVFQQVMGTKVLTLPDVQAPIQIVVTKLQQKNVSLSVAQEIGKAIQQQLVGRTLNSFYSIQTAVQQALESILMNILVQSQKGTSSLTTKSSIDLVQNVIQKRNSQTSLWSSISGASQKNSKRRPYVISVMGINGIGKTTTIAKLAYYFQQNQLTPLLVAGDTFRSGAIEQLRIHADCLNVPFFQQGYSKDPSAVAAAAISHATEQQYDVVLIDTAGRMQNNVPLMKSLNKLMVDNQPDYCIMVCEAIVGHDGINQFQMFQQALGNSRKVDGFILTKFDTVDTKVGACLTLTYECQTPVVFLGVGQKYHHLQPLQVSTIIKGLFA